MNYSNLMLDEFILIHKYSVLVAAVMMESSSYRASILKMRAKLPVFFQMYSHTVMFLSMIAKHLPAYNKLQFFFG